MVEFWWIYQSKYLRLIKIGFVSHGALHKKYSTHRGLFKNSLLYQVKAGSSLKSWIFFFFLQSGVRNRTITIEIAIFTVFYAAYVNFRAKCRNPEFRNRVVECRTSVLLCYRLVWNINSRMKTASRLKGLSYLLADCERKQQHQIHRNIPRLKTSWREKFSYTMAWIKTPQRQLARTGCARHRVTSVQLEAKRQRKVNCS